MPCSIWLLIRENPKGNICEHNKAQAILLKTQSPNLITYPGYENQHRVVLSSR